MSGRGDAVYVAGVLIALTGCVLFQVATVRVPVPATPAEGPVAEVAAADPKPASAPDVVEPLVKTLVASGLDSPDGVAVDSHGETVYVSEEDAARIVSITHGRTRTVVSADTPVYAGDGSARVRVHALRSPEGIALWQDRLLYVVEDLPGGRLIAFPIDEDGRAKQGTVVNVPIRSGAYAWESVVVSTEGQLLLAGSSAEAAAAAEDVQLFEGVILYRDSDGSWWMPCHRMLASFSAVAFSKNGDYAVYASETTGEVEWFDLTTDELWGRGCGRAFASPEGLCVLPDGSLVVAEESGKVIHVDPANGARTVLYETDGDIESVLWDPRGQRLLVTADTAGEVLSLHLGTTYPEAEDRLAAAEVMERDASPGMSAACPAYLAPVLKMAGYNPNHDPELPFGLLAQRLNLVALDARATLVEADYPVPDPIEHVQLAVFRANQIGVSSFGKVQYPVSGFAARLASGELVKTTLESRRLLSADLDAGLVEALGEEQVTVPLAGPARMSSSGVASLHFMGLGRTPDYSLVVDTQHPEQSYMVVYDQTGGVAQYRLDLPAYAGAESWVVALDSEQPEQWARLSGPAAVYAQASPVAVMASPSSQMAVR